MKNEHCPILPERVAIADPRRILESVVSELEALRADAPLFAGGDLIDLHGALLAYELGGRAELIPSVNFAFSGRRLLEARVARAAHRIAGRERGHAASAATLVRSAERIEDLIHLIDPDLRVVVAA